MARIAGVNLPVNKRALVSLTYIHGIGPKYAMDILKANSLDPTKRIKDFSEDEISKIRKSIDESYTVEGDLRSCLLYTSPSPRDAESSRMPSSA